MKKIFLILFSLIFISSCSNSDGIVFPDSFGENQNSIFKTDFDGQTFSTVEADYSVINGSVIITGIKTNTNEVFTLRASNFTLGTFNFNGSLENSAVYILNNPASADIWTTINQSSNSGEITITEINNANNTISGNFNFVGTHLDESTKSFTDGVFTNIPLRVVPVTSSSFTATINGVNYVNDGLSTASVSVGNNDLIMINATKRSTGEILSISLPSDITVGEHDFGFVTNPPLGQYTLAGETYIANGKINILSHNIANKTITATFNFNASPFISNVPNFEVIGEFDVNY